MKILDILPPRNNFPHYKTMKYPKNHKNFNIYINLS